MVRRCDLPHVFSVFLTILEKLKKYPVWLLPIVGCDDSIKAQLRHNTTQHNTKERTMADIYTMNGEEITMGLQGSAVCDEAMQAAKAIAKDRDEIVRLEDDGDLWDVYPDGTVEEGDKW